MAKLNLLYDLGTVKVDKAGLEEIVSAAIRLCDAINALDPDAFPDALSEPACYLAMALNDNDVKEYEV